MIKLKAKDGFELGAYRADPTGTPKGGIVVIQEIFGVNHHMKNLCDQYAKEGYLCVAPALFDRAERDVDLGYDEDARKKGFGLRQKLDWPQILADVEAARNEVAGAGKIGIIGYCFGGSVVWNSSTSARRTRASRSPRSRTSRRRIPRLRCSSTRARVTASPATSAAVSTRKRPTSPRSARSSSSASI
jgi:carboxymethylenebutenolidase